MTSSPVVRSPETNPFLPGFGAVPQVWAGRDDVIRMHERERRARLLGRYTQGAVFIGPSGIGKSVLVNRFAQASVEAGDVVLDPVRVAKRTDPISQLAAAVEKAEQQLASDTFIDALGRLLDRLKVISIKGVELAIQQEGISNPHLVIRDSIAALAETLAKENVSRPRNRQRVLVIRVDELQNAGEAQRSAIINALGDVLEREVLVEVGDGTRSRVSLHLPVLLYLTGLPDLLNRNTDVDTFRRRFTTEPLGMLHDDDIVDALSDPLPGGVSVDPEAARLIASIVAGDPYLFQLVGQHAWNASGADRISVDDVKSADRETYVARLRIVEAAAADIPSGEAEVLAAIYAAAGTDLTVSGAEVARRLNKTPAQIATYAQRLERRAAIHREWGRWRIENRLLHRYQTTGDILPLA